MTDPQKTATYFLIAGEASGDILGVRLMRALAAKTNGAVRFVGVGGPRMRDAGLETLFPQEELAHMGLFELVRHIPHILARIKETVAAVEKARPDALITIDSPDFCFRVAKKLKGRGIPLIHYVAPSVWAWRPGRAKTVAGFLDHLLALLPFEPPYFTREGLDCTFVGHSIIESGADNGNAARFRARHKIDEQDVLLTLLPGSRAGEISRLMPLFGEVVARLHRAHPRLIAVIPLVPHLAARVRSMAEDWPCPVIFTQNDDDKYDAFAASHAALACSGTVAVELALAGLPAVITYRISALTAFLYRRLIKTPYASLVNIMHQKMVVPELLQEQATPENLAQSVDHLLSDMSARQQQKKDLASVAEWMGRGQFIPSECAAQVVLATVEKCRKSAQVSQ